MVIQHADINGDGMFNKPELVRGIALWCVPVRLPLPSRLRKPLLSPEPPLRASGRSGEVADLQLGPAGVFLFSLPVARGCKCHGSLLQSSLPRNARSKLPFVD